MIVSSGEIQLELPAGIYELEMPLPKETAYQYDNEYLIASAGNVSKTVSYTKQTGNRAGRRYADSDAWPWGCIRSIRQD